MKKTSLIFLTVVCLLGCLSLLLVKYKPTRIWISEIDYLYLGGTIFATVGRDMGSLESDLVLYRRLISKADYSWLGEGPIWVAHSLGLEGDEANTPKAFEKAASAGFKIFEIDIRYSAGELHCAHEEDEIESKQVLGCDFAWLMAMAEQKNVWFILDVKTEFQAAYAEISRKLANSAVTKQFIPQIYAFNQIKYIDLDLFSGPLFTGYRRNQGAEVLITTAAKLGLPAITLPPAMINEANELANLRIFSHGIGTEELYLRLEKLGVSGFYIRVPLYDGVQSK